jgi:hypothetical protein
MVAAPTLVAGGPMSAFDTAEYEPSPWAPINDEVARYERG